MEEDKPKPKQSVEIDIAGPLTMWLTLLVIGVAMALIAQPISASDSFVGNLLTSISSWVLYLPGSIALPLIVALWIGERVGATRNSASSGMKAGEINALYVLVIYVVAILIIYLLLYYIAPISLSAISLAHFAEYVILLPAIVLVVLTPLMASLSAIRRSAV